MPALTLPRSHLLPLAHRDYVATALREQPGDMVTIHVPDAIIPTYPPLREPPPAAARRHGLGDLIAAVLRLCGIATAARALTLGRPCGCAERQAEWNRLPLPTKTQLNIALAAVWLTLLCLVILRSI